MIPIFRKLRYPYAATWFLICLAATTNSAPRKPLDDTDSRVISVTDGDTFVLDSGERVRLIGVDCPDSLDPLKPVEYFSTEATQFLDSLISDKQVRLEYGDKRTDRYGRLLCYVWVDDTVLVNREIVKHGYGMAYLQFPHKLEAEFLELELAARRAAIGMWASPRSRPSIRSPEKTKPPDGDAVTVYVTRTGSKYHRGNCQYLRKSKIPMSKADAIAAGYGPCSRCRP